MNQKKGSIMTKRTSQKNGVLTQASSTKTPEESIARTKQELAKYGLKPKEKITVKDQFTGREKTITLDRTGHNEKSLIIALADPDKTRDQKDHALSMYLFERGHENLSMLTDLYRYKGEHTKESRVFQSRMRYDFESFVTNFVMHLESSAFRIGKIFHVDIYGEKKAFEDWLRLPNNKERGYGYRDFRMFTNNSLESQEGMALIEMAIYDIDEAEKLQKAVDNITKARMAQKGYGIYVDKRGQPYSVNDLDLDEIIKKDREIIDEAEKEQYAE